MRHEWIGITVLASTLAGAGPAAAQEKGQVGLVAGYPASIGVLFHVSDGVALRPAFTFSVTSSTNSYIGASQDQQSAETDSYSIGVSIDALFYVKKWDNLRAYVTPGFSYGHGSSTSSNPSFMYTNESTGNSYTVQGSFGAQYALSRRFSVLGEVGLAFGDANSKNVPVGGTGGSTSSSKAFGTRGAIAVVFYFK